MPDRIRRVDYFHVEVPDQAGGAAPVLSKLTENGVNLIAFLAFPIADGKSQLDLVPEDPAVFAKAMKSQNVPISSRKQAIYVQGEDRVGTVADLCARLAAARINVRAAAACATAAGSFGMLLWVAPDKIDAAVKALG